MDGEDQLRKDSRGGDPAAIGPLLAKSCQEACCAWRTLRDGMVQGAQTGGKN